MNQGLKFRRISGHERLAKQSGPHGIERRDIHRHATAIYRRRLAGSQHHPSPNQLFDRSGWNGWCCHGSWCSRSWCGGSWCGGSFRSWCSDRCGCRWSFVSLMLRGCAGLFLGRVACGCGFSALFFARHRDGECDDCENNVRFHGWLSGCLSFPSLFEPGLSPQGRVLPYPVRHCACHEE
jgi:hypothetical protein